MKFRNVKKQGQKPFPELISADIQICERALRELDGVLSLIRVVELFYVTVQPNVAPEMQAVHMTIVANVRAVPNSDNSDHPVELRLTRPDGERKKLEGPTTARLIGNTPGVPGGFGMVLPLAVKITQMGTHYISLLLDGVEIAKTSFTLLERKLEGAS